jgi:bacteriochlorophyllide a dehydrogenase
VLGRLLARLTIAAGAPPPVVWDNQACRRSGATGYEVIAPKDDDRRDYRTIYDVSGYADGLDTLIGKLGKRGEVVLAGFYANRLNFAFAAAFQAEMRLRVAAEFTPDDLVSTRALIDTGALDLTGLLTNIRSAADAPKAYPEALLDPACLKTALDWRITA